MNRALALVAPLLGALVVGCSNEATEAADTSEGAATAEARAQLDAYTGTWKVSEDKSEIRAFPSSIVVTVTDDAVDPTTKETKGTRLRLMSAEHPEVPAVDRAPFVNVDEGKSCSNVDMGGGESVTICHETTLSNGGATLTHVVKITSYQAFILPTGWSTATQVLTLSGGKLHYTYRTDKELTNDVTLTR